MAASDALPIPVRGSAFRLYFDWRKNDGTLLTGAAGVVSQVAKDGAAFATSTNTVTEIGAGTGGVYYLDLTAAEMTSSNTIVKVTSTSTGAVPVVENIYGGSDTTINVNASRVGGSVQATYTQQLLYDNNIITGQVDTGQAPSTTDIYVSFDNASANLATDYLKGRTICFCGIGVTNLAGQAARILGSSYSIPLCHLVLTPLTSAPPNNAKFAII